jgi:hypothetical protein
VRGLPPGGGRALFFFFETGGRASGVELPVGLGRAPCQTADATGETVRAA